MAPRCPKPRYTKKYTDWAELPLLLTTDQVCTILTMSETTLLRNLRNGTIPGKQIGRKWLVSKSALREYVGDVSS